QDFAVDQFAENAELERESFFVRRSRRIRIQARAEVFFYLAAHDFFAVHDGPHVGPGSQLFSARCEGAGCQNRHNDKTRFQPALLPAGTTQAAFFTRPERIQEVQTRTCFRTPLTTALTRRRFGFQRRRRTLWAWLTTLP